MDNKVSDHQSSGDATCAPGRLVGRPYWIWPYRPPEPIARRSLAVAQTLADALGCWPKWLLAGCLAGALPLALDLAMGCDLSRIATAALLTPLLVAAAARDVLGRGLLSMSAAFVAHSLLYIFVASGDPEWLSACQSDGANYWLRSRQWIESGVNPEYETGFWLPAHLQLLAGSSLFSYLSLGFATLWQGLFEVDLMNGYVSQLIVHSNNSWLAGALGWHPWSLCRGIGFLFLTFEVVSLSFQRLTGVLLSTTPRRRRRWLVGLSFLLLDGLLKFHCTEHVRAILAANLL